MTDDNYDPNDPENYVDVDTMAGKDENGESEMTEEDNVEEIDDGNDDEAV